MKDKEIYSKFNAQLTEYLQINHMRYSPVREMILKAIVAHRGAFTATQVYDWIKGQRVSRASIYNVLRVLENAHIIQALKMQTSSREMQYELLKQESNFLQLYCIHCGRTARLQDKSIIHSVMCKEYSNFKVHRFSLYVFGECEKCKKNVKHKS